MSVGEDDDGRDPGTVTFCAVNLKPHTTLGARFEVISTAGGGSLLDGDEGEGFQVRACVCVVLVGPLPAACGGSTSVRPSRAKRREGRETKTV